jgi:DNA-binding HxlR family transcriptional regulator
MAHALDLVGERWALLVIRELVLGAKRYGDLKNDLPGISTNLLSHRLDELAPAGVVRRHRLAPPAGSWVHELTDWGRELEPILRQLGRWGARSPAYRPDKQLSVTSFVLSLRTNVDPDEARKVNGTSSYVSATTGSGPGSWTANSRSPAASPICCRDHRRRPDGAHKRDLRRPRSGRCDRPRRHRHRGRPAIRGTLRGRLHPPCPGRSGLIQKGTVAMGIVVAPTSVSPDGSSAGPRVGRASGPPSRTNWSRTPLLPCRKTSPPE